MNSVLKIILQYHHIFKNMTDVTDCVLNVINEFIFIGLAFFTICIFVKNNFFFNFGMQFVCSDQCVKINIQRRKEVKHYLYVFQQPISFFVYEMVFLKQYQIQEYRDCCSLSLSKILCNCHQVVVLCYSIDYWHMNRCRNITGWPIFRTMQQQQKKIITEKNSDAYLCVCLNRCINS